MSNQFIPLRGLGEVYICVADDMWTMHDCSYYNPLKEIPFFKLLLELGSLNMKFIFSGYEERDIFNSTLINDFKEKTTVLILSFIKIQDLCDDLFATGHIETIECCMIVFHRFIKRKLSDYFFEDYIACQEIKETLQILKRELKNFINYFDELVTILFFFLPDRYRKSINFTLDNSKFKENLNKITEVLAEDFIKQVEIKLKKSEIYKTNKNFCKIFFINQ